MFITIIIDTDHPEAWDNLRADLEALVEHRDEDGRRYAAEVRMTEAVFEGMAPRREFSAECDPSELDAC